MNARKPPTPPAPKLTRAPSKSTEAKIKNVMEMGFTRAIATEMVLDEEKAAHSSAGAHFKRLEHPNSKNPVTWDIMQRVNKAQLDRQISKKEAAAEIGVSYALFRGWQSTGGAPIGDNLVYVQRWLHRHDKTFFADIIDSKRIRLLKD